MLVGSGCALSDQFIQFALQTIQNLVIRISPQRFGATFEVDEVRSTPEPQVGVVKSSIDSIGNDNEVVGLETVDYTLTVSNALGAATAHDLVIVDTVPEGMTPTLPIPDSGVWAVDGTPGDGIGGTITWTITSLAPNTSTPLT